ncbi:hypothetical protein P879_03815, partial [Paragonimus westermani]
SATVNVLPVSPVLCTAQSESHDTIVATGLPETHTSPLYYVTEETTRDRAGLLVDMNLQLRKAESKLDRIRHRFHQLIRALIVTPMKGGTEEPRAQIFTECAFRLRSTLSGIKGLLRGLNNLIHTMSAENSFEHTNQTQPCLSDHAVSSREHDGSQPLAYNCYRRDIIISDASLLAEELREIESLVLSAYELSERMAARILRLEPWIAAHLDKLEQLGNNDRSTVEALSAALVTMSAIKIELRSKLDTVNSVAFESTLLESMLHDLRKTTELDDAMQSSKPTECAYTVPFCESQTSPSNRAGLLSRIAVHSTRLKEMYSHLLEKSVKLTEEICFALIKHGQVSGVLEACQSTLTECDADLSVVHHVNEHQICENMAIDEGQLASFSTLDGVMRLELNQMELDMLNVLFERIEETFLSMSETAEPGPVQQKSPLDVGALKNLH